MRTIEYLCGARRDFDESFDWYAARSAGAAVRFTGAVDAALLKIALNPEQFARIDDLHRECSVRTFPFRIVFRIVDDRVLIVAIAHAKRSPGFWTRR
jgi:plasmid stabilization system protein ParE